MLLSSLSVFRGIMNRSVPKAFYELLLSLDKKPEEFLGAYGKLCSMLCERGCADKFAFAISETALFDDNCFARAATAGRQGELPENVVSAVKTDCDAILTAAKLTSDEVLEAYTYADEIKELIPILPKWQTGKCAPCFDGFDGFDPFGFGFGFGGYQQGYGQQGGASYSGSDSPEMQAARNFVANGRYAEARRVLDSMTGRNARWYYLSSLANQGLGNSIDALQDARRAVQLDPNNTEYQMHLRRMQNPGQTYRTAQTTYTRPGGLMQWCWSMILLNLLCNCCCGGWGFRFRM